MKRHIRFYARCFAMNSATTFHSQGLLLRVVLLVWMLKLATAGKCYQGLAAFWAATSRV